MNQVDRVIRGVHANQPHRESYIIRSCLAFDQIQHLEGDLFRIFNLCAGSSAEPKRYLTRLRGRENLNSQSPREEPNDQHSRDQVNAEDEPAQSYGALCESRVARLETSEIAPGWGRLVPTRFLRTCKLGGRAVSSLGHAQNPDRQNRDEGAREEIGREHRETNCERKRDEQGLGCAGHEKGWNEDSDNAKHGQQSRNRCLKS